MPTTIVLRKGRNADGGYWYTRPGGIRYTQADQIQAMREGNDLEFENSPAEKELLGLCAALEKQSIPGEKINFNSLGDTKLLTKIIRMGGFCSYINNLEGKFENNPQRTN